MSLKVVGVIFSSNWPMIFAKFHENVSNGFKLKERT